MPQQKYADIAIPLILLILVGAVIGCKMFDVCPPFLEDILGGGKSVQTLIITNEQDLEGARQFARDVSSRVTKITPVVDPNVLKHIRTGTITSGNYDLVVLYGDNTALTYEARKEITDYVDSGGSLLIIKGAGLKSMNTDGTISEYAFGWATDEMADIIEFKEDCPTLTKCTDIASITALASEMSEFQLTPVQYEHPLITRLGLNAPLEIDISKYPGFTGLVRVVDDGNNKVAWVDWYDADHKPHSSPAFIAYSSGMGGGRVVFLAYNPIELNHEDLFRNIIQHALKET